MKEHVKEFVYFIFKNIESINQRLQQNLKKKKKYNSKYQEYGIFVFFIHVIGIEQVLPEFIIGELD